MREIFIVGTSHERYQIRPSGRQQDGANAFRRHVLQTVQSWRVQTIAEEMSEEGLRGRRTVCGEVAKDESLSHILCDPNRSEREALGISENTPSDNEKREKEWLRRLQSSRYPVLFVCGATHVGSFARCCGDEGLVPTIVTDDFEAPGIPLDRQFL
jgi:hypothetical protein